MTAVPKSHKHPLSVKFWAVLLFVMTIPMFGAAQNADQQADSSVIVYVPVDLPDCMRQLDAPLRERETVQPLQNTVLLIFIKYYGRFQKMFILDDLFAF